MIAKRSNYYIPVTVDELMARFVTNMNRGDCLNRFRVSKRKTLEDNLW
jgi:hypothetical protein